MLKFVDTLVGFSEVPDEISLCINFSGCPIHCPDCHSKYLWEDSGEILTTDRLYQLIEENKGISCICFMGGVQDKKSIEFFLEKCKEKYPELKTAWYSGESHFPQIETKNLDYLKFGPYIKERGSLNSKNTNQRMLMFNHANGILAPAWYISDITYKFWRNESKS